MSKAEERGGRGGKELTSLDSAFEPEPVDPEEARRRESSASSPAARAIVELTSPIGHRLRVPPPPAEGAPAPVAPETKKPAR